MHRSRYLQLFRAPCQYDISAVRRVIRTGYISILADVTEEFSHEGYAETTDLIVGFTLGIKVRTSLSAADVQARQSILECLLEAEEFKDRKVDRGMQTQSTFVRAQCGVVLDQIQCSDTLYDEQCECTWTRYPRLT